MTEVYLSALLKIGKKERMENLLRKGHVFMNTVQYFKETELNSQQSDPNEGAHAHLQLQNKTIWITKIGEVELEKKIEGKIQSGQIRLYGRNPPGNIFCMYGITKEWLETNGRIDPKNREFGTSIVAITNVPAFIERVMAALDAQGLKGELRPVEYYDEQTFNGELSVFCKPSRLEHQCEFRFFVERDTDQPLELYIGSIEDIAMILEVTDFEDFRIEEIPESEG